MRSNKGLVTAVVVILFAFASGCGSALDALPGSGGGGGSKSGGSLTPQLATGTLTGVVQDGVVSGADVNVYAWEGQKGELLASGATDSRGRYSIALRARSQPVLIEATGGRYREEMTGKTVSLTDDQVILALQNYTSGQRVASSLSYYTTLATGLAEHLVRLGTRPPDAVAEANGRVSRIIGVNASSVIPTDILAPDNFSLPELQYGFATAALSSLTERSSILNGDEPHNVFTSILFIQSAYDDVRADGVLNGRGVNGEFTFGRIRLTPRLYRHELALHILRIANNQSANRTGLGARDMFDLARRLNDSTDPMFDGEPVIPIDGDRPNVSAIAARQFPNLPDGAVVFGGLDLSAMVATFPGAVRTELILDGQVIGTAADPENPSVRLDTVNRPIPDGPHTLAFRVTDISGAIGESPLLNVNVSNQQTAIANVSIAGRFVGAVPTVVTANIADPAGVQKVEYSVRSRGATAFMPVATITPSGGVAMLQSSASIAFSEPQFADGDATFRVAVTNSAGVTFSREVPFILDFQAPTANVITAGVARFFDKNSGVRCTPRLPPDLTDSCLLYLGSPASAFGAQVRDNRLVRGVTLTVEGGAVATPGRNDDDNATPMSIFFLFDQQNPRTGFREQVNLGPDGQKTFTLNTVDGVQNTSVTRQSVVVDKTPPTISNFQIVPADANSTVRQVNGVTMVSGRINISAVIEDASGVIATQVFIPGRDGANTVNTLAGELDRALTRTTVQLRGYDTSNLPTEDSVFFPTISVFGRDLADNLSSVQMRVRRMAR